MYAEFPRLEERQTQKAGTLSGDERQLLAIVRALKQRTDFPCSTNHERLAPESSKMSNGPPSASVRRDDSRTP
ncbi:ABC-type transport system ATP-binding protein (probable substrate branched-chain amino acids) [Halogranum salarium B-1]|uniref:ABC-type transport system ATP-binding protein (Probable substrate branched-chain amino acids) n=1 Tax=Halogranum salarium B-1 TaxID=1210908 RepID=J3JGV1_9EURY|nr:branched-chain amino acid ABC transporter ATP-binding protein [Halogranum salarium]EJN60449.1 ABC-type transport system ATP-binding protein (probable substrate branched-chain amino acids) [Halogranum salarium B-1]